MFVPDFDDSTSGFWDGGDWISPDALAPPRHENEIWMIVRKDLAKRTGKPTPGILPEPSSRCSRRGLTRLGKLASRIRRSVSTMSDRESSYSQDSVLSLVSSRCAVVHRELSTAISPSHAKRVGRSALDQCTGREKYGPRESRSGEKCPSRMRAPRCGSEVFGNRAFGWLNATSSSGPSPCKCPTPISIVVSGRT